MYDWRRMLRLVGRWSRTCGSSWRFGVGSRLMTFNYGVMNLHICPFAHFHIYSLDLPSQMVVVAQLVRALDCGSRGRGFEPRHPPIFSLLLKISHPFT